MMTYRIAVKQDAEIIARLHASSWQDAYKGILSDDYLKNRVYSERLDIWKQRLNNPSQDRLVMIAERYQQALGFVCVFGNSDASFGALLDNLHVSSDARGQGIGKTFMQQTAKWIVERYDNKGLYLFVFEANRSACRFYEHTGGTKAGLFNFSMPDGNSVPSIRYVWENVSVLLT